VLSDASASRDRAGMVPTTGSFDLVGVDGELIWNEGRPADIPVVDGVRLVVLDPPTTGGTGPRAASSPASPATSRTTTPSRLRSRPACSPEPVP
jgi:hypothetical protein